MLPEVREPFSIDIPLPRPSIPELRVSSRAVGLRADVPARIERRIGGNEIDGFIRQTTENRQVITEVEAAGWGALRR